MLAIYKVAVMMLVYLALFYVFWVDEYRQLLKKLVDKYRNQSAYYLNIVLGSIHMAFGIYIAGCIIYLLWNL